MSPKPDFEGTASSDLPLKQSNSHYLMIAVIAAFLLACTLSVVVISLQNGKRPLDVEGNRQQCLAAARTTIQDTGLFVSWYSNATDWIAHYDESVGDPEWNAVAGVADRFVIQARIPICINKENVSVKLCGKREVVVREVARVDAKPDGRHEVIYTGKEWWISQRDWDALVASNGDLRSIGVPTDSAVAVPNFNKAIEP